MSGLVPDEVWRRLDPNAGRLSRRAAARLWVAGALVMFAALGYPFGVASGAFGPNLGLGSTAFEYEPGASITYDLVLLNEGLFPVTVLKVGERDDGLKLAGVEAALPASLKRGEGLPVRLNYVVTDCNDLPYWVAPVLVRVKGRWGETSVSVANRALIGASYPSLKEIVPECASTAPR